MWWRNWRGNYKSIFSITSTDDGINVQNSFYGTDSYDSTAEISMNFYGGNVYVNAEGDGLDANGDINIYGGSIEVWGMAAGGDNEPVDHDDNLIINDATLIAGGSKGTSYTHNGITSTNQYSIYTTESITMVLQFMLKMKKIILLIQLLLLKI